MAEALEAAGAVGGIGCVVGGRTMEGGMKVDFEGFGHHGVLRVSMCGYVVVVVVWWVRQVDGVGR